jgi:putative ABC transport system ATP-binding protein
MINIRNLKKGFQFQEEYLPILDIEALDFSKGDRVAIVGPSGCGKSTLLHIIGGLMKPDEGSIIIEDQNISQISERGRDQWRSKNIGFVFQDFHLIPSLTAEENVKLMLPNQMPKAMQNELLQHWFARVGLLDRRGHRPDQLSRGQQQRVAMIRALIHQPTIILADEPTGSLDYETADEVMNLLLELCRANQQTLLCVTHDLPLAERFPKLLRLNEYNEKRRRLA